MKVTYFMHYSQTTNKREYMGSASHKHKHRVFVGRRENRKCTCT